MPLVSRVKGGFVKLKFKVALLKENNDLPLPKEVLSKGGFMKLAPDLKDIPSIENYELDLYKQHVQCP